MTHSISETPHPWPFNSYARVTNFSTKRFGDCGRITSAQKIKPEHSRYPKHILPPIIGVWEYRLEFSDLQIFWISSADLELLTIPQMPQIPGDDL